MPLQMTTIPGVPIVSTGTYLLSTGPATFTEEDLRAAVAALADPAVRVPRVRISGLDELFAGSDHGGEPALGRAENMRVSDDGQTLYADLVVPDWLAAVMPDMYPSRSIEGGFGVQTATGHTHDLVITAVALLGVDLPGVSTLPDVAELLQENGPVPVAATIARMPARVVAGLDQDLVRRRFYEWISGEDAELPEGAVAFDLWVRSMRFDDQGRAYLKVEDDGSGRLYRVDFEVSGSEVTFQAFQEVVEQDVPVAASGPRPRLPIATWNTAVESRAIIHASTPTSTTPEESAMTEEQRRALALSLGLDPETATVEQIHEAAAARAAEANPGDPPADQPPADQPPADQPPADQPPVEQPEAVAASAVPPGMRLVDEATLAELQAGAADGVEARREQREAERDRVLAAAMQEGRFPPARRDHYVQAWARDPEGTRTLLTASPEDGGLAPGLVPVSARGLEPQEQLETAAEEHEAYMQRHFPQVAARRASRGEGLRVRTEV